MLPLTQSRLAPAFNLTYHVLLAGSIAVLPLLVRNYQYFSLWSYFSVIVLRFCCVKLLLPLIVVALVGVVHLISAVESSANVLVQRTMSLN